MVEMKNTLVESFVSNAKSHPDKFCLGWKLERWSYGEVCKQVLHLVAHLCNECGVMPGDIVMISAVARPDYVVALLATQYIGAISVPIDRMIKPDTLEKLVAYVKPKILLCDGAADGCQCAVLSLAGIVKAAKCVQDRYIDQVLEYKIPQLTDVAEMLFTTGTTGLPKGAMLSHVSIKAIMENTWRGVSMREDDIVLIPLPLNHSVGMRVLRTALAIGASVVIQNGFTFAHDLEENINSFGCTALVSVPTSIEMVRAQMRDRFAQIIGKLRYVEMGAGSLSAPMKRTLAAELPNTNLYNTWGSSETGGVIFLDIKKALDKLDSLGRCVDGVEFGVLREDGQIHNDAVSKETAGRMALRGPMHMVGYFNRTMETEDAVRGDWLVTNDLAYKDSDGFVYMLGRADDVINVGGEKVAPIEIESVACEFPGIRECAVVASSDALMGQVPVMFYATSDADIDHTEFMQFMSARVEAYKVPQKLVRVDALPRNAMMKLDRKVLKAMLSDDERNGGDGDSVIRNIMTRKSIRDFTEQPVPRELLEKIIACGIQAPTGHNMQSWRFTVITKRDTIEAFKSVFVRKAKQYKAVCYGFNNPSVAILITNDARNKNGAQDSACAAENMMLAAHALGLGSVWQNTISYMPDDEEVRKLLDGLNVPARQRPWLMLLIGYPASRDIVSPKRRTDVVNWQD